MIARAPRVDPSLLTAAARAIRPRERLRPSEFARRYIRLESDEAAVAGDYDPGYLPWLQAVLDVQYDNPDKIGMMCYKPSQLGMSIAAFVKLIQACVEVGGPMLYMIGKQEKAAEMSDRRFRAIALKCKPFRELLSDDQAEVQGWSEVRYRGGTIDFYGAGSPSDLATNPYRRIFGDEFHLILDVAKSKYGGPFNQLVGRTTQQRDVWMEFFGHPTVEDSAFDVAYKALTDQRAWVWDCPHCKGVVRLDGMDNVDIPTNAAGNPDPYAARLLCPCCGKEITDAQRAEAVWPRSAKHPNGSGRFESGLEEQEARGRLLVGLEIHGLNNPRRTLTQTVRLYLAAKSDADKQSFYNYILGQKYTPAARRINMRALDDCRPRQPITMLKGLTVQGGIRFVTAGVDVQWPKENPWLYSMAIAWAANGFAYVFRRKMQGWAALHHWARTFGVDWAHEDGTKGGTLGIATLAIDTQGQMSGTIKDQCRLANSTCYSAHGGHRVQWLPVGYNPNMKSDEVVWQYVTTESRIIDPIRPELGPLEQCDLRRHAWVDRTFGMVQDARLVFMEDIDAELQAHFASNVMQPLKRRHGQEEVRMEWVLPKGLYDDWARAVDYATAAAVIKHKLDLIHELDAPVGLRTPSNRKSYAERRHGGWIPETGGWFN